MTMNGWPFPISIAYTVQMFGWFSALAARASRWKRSRTAGSAVDTGRNFNATSRPSLLIFRSEDDAHPTTAEVTTHAVVKDCGADLRQAAHHIAHVLIRDDTTWTLERSGMTSRT